MTPVTWREVQQTFNQSGFKVSKKKARWVLALLPGGALATGQTEREMLKDVAVNVGRGSMQRLYVAVEAQRMARRGAQ